MSKKAKTQVKVITVYPLPNEPEWITPISWESLPKQNQKVLPLKTSDSGNTAECLNQVKQSARKRIKSRKGRLLSGPPNPTLAQYIV